MAEMSVDGSKAMGWDETNIDRQTDGHIGKEKKRRNKARRHDRERKNNEEDWKGHLRLNWESIENLIMSFLFERWDKKILFLLRQMW